MSVACPVFLSFTESGVIQHDRSYCILADVPRRSVADVAASRASAVELAVDLASIEGLEGITIGRLATELGMSKSGLIGRFGDKQAIQRAALAAANERFTDAVWRPARHREPGLPRLEAIVDAWIGHLRDGVFPGGCFVTTASVEYDSRPGPLHDDIAQAVRSWLGVLETEAQRARDAGSGAAEGDDGAMSRINLRMPDRLKARVEQAAAGDGLSVNAWLVRATSAALQRTTTDRQRAPRTPQGAQRYTGWAR
jgi:AcrR family transcriptional regulator